MSPKTEKVGLTGELELYPSAGESSAKLLKAMGVTTMFGVTGGHLFNLLDPTLREGIFHITFRHEQTGGYAAEAYARVMGNKPGVCYATVGPGSTNVLSPIAQAHGSNTPVMLLLAGHEANHDRAYPLQEIRGWELYRPVTKWCERITDTTSYKYFLTKAYKECQEPKRGPIMLEFETNALLGLTVPTAPRDENYIDDWLKQPQKKAGATDADIAQMVKAIFGATKVALFVGDGIRWNDASKELTEFCELAKVPIVGRRAARGAVPENHHMVFRGAGPLRESDLILFMGHRVDYFDGWGQGWGVKRCIQVNDTPEFIHPWFPTEIALVADTKVVLQQMIDYIKTLKLQPPQGRVEWVDSVQAKNSRIREAQFTSADKYKSYAAPLHGSYLCAEIWRAIDDLYKGRCYMIWDSFTGSNVLGPFVEAQFAGQMLDANVLAGVGHGIGQGIGTAMALREKGENTPIFAMMGDAGMGLGGMDIETAVRYRLGGVYCVWNNDGWHPVAKSLWWGPNMELYKWPEQQKKNPWYYAPHEFLPDLRYDKMFEACGAHGEWVTQPDQIRPALERCFKASEKGQPAILNCDVRWDTPVQTTFAAPISAAVGRHIAWDELPFRGKMCRIEAGFVPEAIQEKYGIKYQKYDIKEPMLDAHEEQWDVYDFKSEEIFRPVPPWYEEAQKRIEDWK
ncbi:thiamine pyrophosphate-binding protein [Chloroflexota bacterium]